MNRTKYLFSVLVGTLTYVLFSLTAGQNSFRVLKNLEEQKQLLSVQVVEIQNINSELSLEYSALLNDKDVIAAYARKLDYVNDGEKLVKVTGLKPAENSLYNTGKLLRHTDCDYISEKYCKIVGLFFGLMTFVIMFLYDINRGNISFGKKESLHVAGIPVYEVKQI